MLKVIDFQDNILTQPAASEKLPNEVVLSILLHLDVTNLASIFRVSKLFNQLALVTHYAQHNVSPPFSRASFTSSEFSGLSLALASPPLQSLTLKFNEFNILHTVNSLGSFCARAPQPIPFIHLIFPYDLLSSSSEMPQTHTLLKSLGSLLTAATNSGQGNSLIRASHAGIHLMPISSPLLPEVNRFNPSPSFLDAQTSTPEEEHADREPLTIASLLFIIILGQTENPNSFYSTPTSFYLTPMSCAAILLSVIYFVWWGISRWKRIQRPTATSVKCEGVVRKVPSITKLVSIEINLPSEEQQIFNTNLKTPMRPLLIFDREDTESLRIPSTSEVPISPSQIEELFHDTHFPALQSFSVKAGCDSCVTNTTLFSFLTCHPSIRTLEYLPTIVPTPRSVNGHSMTRNSVLQDLLILRASPEFIAYLSNETGNKFDDANPPNLLPTPDFLPNLRGLEIVLRTAPTIPIPPSSCVAINAALHTLSSRSAPIHLELSVPEDGHEGEWLDPYETSDLQDGVSSPSMPYVPCVTVLGLNWYPSYTTPAIPKVLRRFPALERLALRDLVWDEKKWDAWHTRVGEKCPYERPRDRGLWKINFIQQLRRSFPLLTSLMIGRVEKGLDEWEATFALEEI